MSILDSLRTWTPLGAVPEISPAELHAALKSEAPPQLVDVRTSLEWTQSRIAGSLSLPITSFAARLPELGLDSTRPVIAICLSAHRSIPAVRVLRERGFTAMQLAGGMFAWWAAKLPVEKGDSD
ncbi:MAG: rhodanese-like domain-containing protein [Polyangiaceae bacterium]